MSLIKTLAVMCIALTKTMPSRIAAFLDAFFDLRGDSEKLPSSVCFEPKFFSIGFHVRSRFMEWFSWVGDPNSWVSLATLTFLEIVLGLSHL